MFRKTLSRLRTKEKCIVFSVNRFIGKKRGVVGGLSDRLQGALFAYLLARLTGRRFYIDWNHPFDIRDIFEPRKVNWNISEINFCYSKTIDLIDGYFTEEKKDLIRRGRDGIEELFGRSKIVKIHCNSMPLECFSDVEIDDELLKHALGNQKTFFYTFFNEIFSYKIPGNLEKDFNKFTKHRETYGYIVGLQFRTGGGSRWGDPNIDNLDNVNDLLRAMENLLLKRGVKEYSVFLTTDNNDVKSIVRKKLEGVANLIVFDEDPVHIELSDLDVVKGGAVQTFFEHYLLGQCDLIVCGKGGFGTTAAFRENKSAVRYFWVD